MTIHTCRGSCFLLCCTSHSCKELQTLLARGTPLRFAVSLPCCRAASVAADECAAAVACRLRCLGESFGNAAALSEL